MIHDTNAKIIYKRLLKKMTSSICQLSGSVTANRSRVRSLFWLLERFFKIFFISFYIFITKKWPEHEYNCLETIITRNLTNFKEKKTENGETRREQRNLFGYSSFGCSLLRTANWLFSTFDILSPFSWLFSTVGRLLFVFFLTFFRWTSIRSSFWEGDCFVFSLGLLMFQILTQTGQKSPENFKFLKIVSGILRLLTSRTPNRLFLQVKAPHFASF